MSLSASPGPAAAASGKSDRRIAPSQRLGWGLLGATLGAMVYYCLAEFGFSRLMGPPATGMAWWGAAGGLLGLSRLRLIPPFFAVGCGTILLLVGQTRLIEAPARRLVRRDTLPPAPVGAVVVLSGSLTPTGLLQRSAADRLLEGLQLLHAGVARRLVLSRVQATGPGGLRLNSDSDQQWFLRLLTPEPRVDILSAASTREEAEATAALARREGWQQIVVVTSPLHSRRACAAFEAVGLRVVCRPCPDREYGLERMTPGERIRAFRDWVYETVGWVSYRRRGWVQA